MSEFKIDYRELSKQLLDERQEAYPVNKGFLQA